MYFRKFKIWLIAIVLSTVLLGLNTFVQDKLDGKNFYAYNPAFDKQNKK